MMEMTLRPPTMATAQTTTRRSNRFIDSPRSDSGRRCAVLNRSLDSRSCGTRQMFFEGGWPSIKVRLEMGRWSPCQIDQIHEQLRQGWPLALAVRHVALRNGLCPLRSRPLG